MNTNLPSTNNLWLLSFIGGIILIYLGLSKLDENYRLEQIAYNDLKVEYLNLKKDLFLQKRFSENTEIIKSLNNANLSKDQTALFNDLSNLNSRLFLKIEENKILRDTDKELEKYEEKINEFKLKLNNNIGYSIILLGTIFLFIGFFKLRQLQLYRDLILYNDFLNLKVHHENCQSCGIELIDDKNFDKLSDYCSYCYTDGQFNHPDLSLNDFKEIIRQQLKNKKLSRVERFLYLNNISTLKRWRNSFSWN